MRREALYIAVAFLFVWMTLGANTQLTWAQTPKNSDTVGNEVPEPASGDADIIDEKDEDLFTDFDKMIEEDLDTLFDEISAEEDVEEKEEFPELFKDEIADDVEKEKSLMPDDDVPSLIKD